MILLKLGSSGPDVKTWQKVLGVTADGSFGPATQQATIDWQNGHGLTADGVVGPATWSKAGLTMPKAKIPDLESYIEGHEGRRPHVYDDTEGHPTAGVGFNLDRPDARAKLESVGADYDAVRAGEQDLTNSQIDKLFAITVKEATDGAKKLLPNFSSLKKPAQIVLIDMVFNMGVGGVAGFTSMLGALSRKDYEGAVDGMKNSKWATQVGSRATADMSLMLMPVSIIGAGTLLFAGLLGLAAYALSKEG